MSEIVQIRKKGKGGCVEQFEREISDVDAYTVFNDRMARNFGMDMSWHQFNQLFEIVRFKESAPRNTCAGGENVEGSDLRPTVREDSGSE